MGLGRRRTIIRTGGRVGLKSRGRWKGGVGKERTMVRMGGRVGLGRRGRCYVWGEG